MKVRVLIVEDEQLIRWSLRQKFETRGYKVTEVENGKEAFEALDRDTYDLIMLDYRLPDTTGLDILRQVRQVDNDVVVIMMTAFSSVESAVDAIKLGAFDYVSKPFDMEAVLRTVEKALETTKLRREVRELRRHIQHEYGADRIIGQAQCMHELFQTIHQVASSGASGSSGLALGNYADQA